MKNPIFAVIMAGGSGERFWPLSRQHKPKQLLRLTGESHTMLEETIDRISPLVPAERIAIATNRLLEKPIRKALQGIPSENILCEPIRRNTAGCLVYATAYILTRIDSETDDPVIANITADHRIGDVELFRRTLSTAISFAQEEEALVTVGIKPTRPETGYGYIELPENAEPVMEREDIQVFHVTQFLEKPTRENAERYLTSGRFHWNSGMFFWRLSTFMAGLERAIPHLAHSIRDIRDELLKPMSDETKIGYIFERLPNISIDSALLEKSDRVYMVRGDYPWDDVGAWDSLSRFWKTDEAGNVLVGDPILIDCRNTTVYNEPGAERTAVGAIGLEDAVVVSTEDGILVCAKNHSQDVRKIVEELKKRKAKQL